MATADSFTESVGRRLTWIRGHRSLSVAVLLWLLDVFTSNWVAGTAVPWIWGSLDTLLFRRPAGPLGILVILLFAWSALERNPAVAGWRRSRVPAPASPVVFMSPEDRYELEFMGTVWHDAGRKCCHHAVQVIGEIVNKYADKNPYLKLLRPVEDSLQESTLALDRMLEPEAPVTLSSATGALETVLRNYVQAIHWINRVYKDHPEYPTFSAYSHTVFAEWHSKFADRLSKDLAPRTRFQGRKLIFDRDAVLLESQPPHWGSLPKANDEQVEPE